MDEREQIPDGDSLFITLSQATVADGAPPDACLSATARALCLMALSWRPSTASVADARRFVHDLVEQSLQQLSRHPFVANRPPS